MQFEVWAPEADTVVLEAAEVRYPMERDPLREGWWSAGAEAVDGDRYGFRVDDGPLLPDPRSRRQPDGPDGPSAVVDQGAYAWREGWAGRRLTRAVLYELHVGTYTPEGTFDAAAARLGHLAELGVTHVSLMPVCPFPGTNGWGYEGVSLWAVHEPYGGPEGLKRFVDTAHGLGLGVILDVVHNHLGPSGNYLPAFGPYFTDTHHTPWGAAVNLDAPGSDEVRAFLLGSALAWLRDYRLDGLRLDAVHALADTRALTFLEELSTAVDALAVELGRPLGLIAESDLCDPRTTTPRPAGGLGLHAQWNDDFHHALHTALTGESQGYYADFARAPLAALAKTVTSAFFHNGTWSSFRGRTHGRPVDVTRSPAHRFVGYAQTHDQIGNRALGDRLAASLSPGLQACAATLVLTGPFTPMLFMGEEWGARTPWQFFTDHTDPELAEAVRNGRRREFGAHGWAEEEIPDPQDPATRDRSCLDWSEPEREPHARLLDWYRRLIALRRTLPDLHDPDLASVKTAFDEDARWIAYRRGDLRIAVNLADKPAAIPLGSGRHRRVGGRVVAAWEPVGAPGADGVLHLPPESCVVLADE
ncbi:malto-oligosyltrehalose trehalohydrolase [Streptomyces microflavus]|uniref:Malto-oligosyltrehalose trehalohydrolase n=2 Tax=Streptomyces microflavus TaxID=1919 RepID=A0A7J0D1R2_STRMI|nr:MULTISPECIES: malto-oligosyltrehalose trehalohydrolase [Streptomyces]AGK80922.1 Malto-oligosyltrehalose trehalohydrolase [Streptomyces microflavus DSM 40593]MCX4655981.1 malto-oligosyltrehalose trehalohydrolase [Streptomyces microflavus]MDX2979036.1 malto-oligosyltrehalose trehalohydrolase [Streptomyces sp. NRRL_B-2249]SCK36347.1 maltooligosyl trehalose hydrolase [Streptomyces sp. ScaeMP-e48]GFN08094.1 malto-oligosyltrehalose trehalohydrolase [Streptomyces microflavus]